MATYRVTDPSTGRTIKLTGDSPPTEAELSQIFSSMVPPTPKPSLMNQVSNALEVPEKMSRQGLQMIAQGVSPQQQVTGNLPRDIAMNIPRIGSETMAEVAPEFISKGSLLTVGALKGAKLAAPAIKAVGRGLARGAESISGLEYKTPGVLIEAAKNPKLLFSPGKSSVEYESAKKVGGGVRKTLSKIPEKMGVVKRAMELADKGKLRPTEALEARKELSAIKKTVSGEFFRKATEKFNEIAKPVFGEADKAFRQGIKADALRQFLPVNKGGGTSIAKSTLGTIAGAAPLAAMSPIVQAGVATALGATAKAVAPLANNAVTTAGAVKVAKMIKKLSEEKAREFLKRAKGVKEKARQLARQEGWEIPE